MVRNILSAMAREFKLICLLVLAFIIGLVNIQRRHQVQLLLHSSEESSKQVQLIQEKQELMLKAQGERQSELEQILIELQGKKVD